jgi:hypothetical protein
MAKTKSKVDYKQLLLNKGEYIVLGIAGFFLVLLLISGVSKWMSAQDPTKIATNLKSSAQGVYTKIQGTQINPEDEKGTLIPEWLKNPNAFPPVPVREFAITGPQFDPIAKPDTKKENPIVFPLGEYQANLVRLPMKAFDIINDNEGNSFIGVIVDKTIEKMDEQARNNLAKNMKKAAAKGAEAQNRLNSGPSRGPGPGGFGPGPGGPGGPGGGPGGPGGFGPGPGGPGGFGPGPGGQGGFGPGMGGSGGRMGGPGGLMGGAGGRMGFDANGKRPPEKTLEYIPIEDLDKAMASGKSPALTVLPLRGVIIHMEVPYKLQIEEIKRALRLATDAEAMQWGPIYDGYEVQRKVTELNADGQPETSDWADYKFEDVYQQRINSKKFADALEEGYSSYFMRYEMALALPLPQLVSELGNYPPIILPNINATIKKLQESGLKKVTPSETVERLQGKTLRNDLYQVRSGNEMGLSSLYGQNNAPGMGGDQPKRPNLPGGALPSSPTGPFRSGMIDSSNTNSATPVQVEQLLLRFVDVDVQPGKGYEYRIRLRMLNPNYQRTAEVANPAYAREEVLRSKWTEIPRRITIPSERELFAGDVAAYRKTVEETYTTTREKELRDRLQVKDNQAVVEICEWMEQVRTTSGKREPVGAWVVADIPVSRGEFIGRRHYVKLPIWSSENKSYVLREITTSAGKTGPKELNQPKGWVVDFAPGTPEILVDFDGGRVVTRQGVKSITEDVATELLILAPNGKLTVKKSLVDENNPDRKHITSVWNKWIADAERRKAAGTTAEDGFAPKPGGGM